MIMEFLHKYHFTDEDINELMQNLEPMDIAEFSMHEERIDQIFQYLYSLNITNFKELLCYRPNLFYESVDCIKKAIENAEDNNIILLLQEDPMNFELIGL